MITLYVIVTDDGEDLQMIAHPIAAMDAYARQIKKPHKHVVMFEMEVEGFAKMLAYSIAYAKMKNRDYVAIAEHRVEPVVEPSLDSIDIYSEDALKAAFECGVEAGKERPDYSEAFIVNLKWAEALANVKEKYAS